MGRRSRGPRRKITVRVPEEHAEAYEAAAARLGLDVSTYFTKAMAEDHGLDVPEYATARRKAGAGMT